MFLLFIIALLLGGVSADINNIEVSTYDTRLKFEPSSHPILLVPGIGGTTLYYSYTQSGEKKYEQLWPTPQSSLYPLLTRYDIEIGYYGGTYGLDGVDCLYHSFLGCEYTYMGNFIKSLTDIGYVPGRNLFAFPYDWRLSVNESTNIERLHSMIEKYNPIVIAHSMGGLVVEEYFRKYPVNNIRKFYAVAVPFKGVGGNILKGFIKGYNFGNKYLSLDTSRDIIMESYSAYWLLFNKFMIEPPTINYKEPVQYLLDNGFIRKDRLIERTPIKISDTDVYYVVGGSQQTPFSYQYGSDSFTYILGDGTVPLISAIHYEVHGQPDSNVIKIDNVDHMGIVDSLFKNLYFNIFSCNYDGNYYYSGKRITVVNGVAFHESIGRVAIIYYYGCDKIEYNNDDYIRQMGNECSGYHLYEVRYYPNSVYKKECWYGYIIESNKTLCVDTTKMYDQNKDRCIDKPIIRPPREALENGPEVEEGRVPGSSNNGASIDKYPNQFILMGVIGVLSVLLIIFVAVTIKMYVNKRNSHDYNAVPMEL